MQSSPVRTTIAGVREGEAAQVLSLSTKTVREYVQRADGVSRCGHNPVNDSDTRHNRVPQTPVRLLITNKISPRLPITRFGIWLAT
jgi:hypothetical protein